MTEEESHLEQGQIERARRLREKIEQLKSGAPPKQEPGAKKSIKEQIAEREAEQKRTESE
ncbi:MAG TPA: hypothetical protein VKE71_08465 [Candidatus Angelobacter sp.]|nr:hypothetical protein [Candidatus Angelobacter sp.]